ncbi:MAG: methyl-accepting chemotaxis protein [Nitrospirae bacterium]|nr:methyl-accepting chemotaxis protein [Nitrospirota bacterium]
MFTKKLKNIRIRLLINSAVILLSLLCLILSLFLGWGAYKERITAIRLSKMNEMADRIIAAAAQEALERGLTATALSSSDGVSAGVIEKIQEARGSGDAALSEAISIAQEIAAKEPVSRFSIILSNVTLAHKNLLEARKWVDKSLESKAMYIEPGDWFNRVTVLIDSAARLRQVAFASTKPLEQITYDNLVLKQAVWLISENMGRERGTIGPIIAARKSIEPAVMEKLKAYQAVVKLGIADILELKEAKGIDPRVTQSVEVMENAITRFTDTRMDVYQAAERGNYPISPKEWITMSTETIDKVLAVSKAVTDVNREKAEEIMGENFRGMAVAIVQIVGSMLFMLFVLILVHEKVRRIERLRDSMVELSSGDGDLTFRLDTSSEDEIGKTAEAFNSFMDQLHGIINQVKKTTDQVASASTELSATAEQMANGSTEQSQQAMHAASAIEEMSLSVTEVAKNASEMARFSKGSNEIAEKGSEVVKESVAGMQKIARSVNEVARVIETLGASSTQIGEIVSVIDNIAEQTNLLALNAAIEAARAKEEGRGFAVVADEVRKLADRTTKATSEIASMIKTIQADIQRTVTVMNEGTSEVESGVMLAHKSGEALRQIVEDAQKITDMILQIATTAEEQSSVSSEISRNVEKISCLSQENNTAASQTARASDDLLNLATGLQQMVSRFKV